MGIIPKIRDCLHCGREFREDGETGTIVFDEIHWKYTCTRWCYRECCDRLADGWPDRRPTNGHVIWYFPPGERDGHP